MSTLRSQTWDHSREHLRTLTEMRTCSTTAQSGSKLQGCHNNGTICAFAMSSFFDARVTGDAWWTLSLSWTTDGVEAIRITDPRHPVGGEGVTIGADGVIATTALAYPDTSVLAVTPDGATRFLVAGPD